MAACRRLTCFTKKQFYLRKSLSFYSTTSSNKDSLNEKEIVIPYRIERGPTDILKALSSTISKDHTAAHYRYEDDPYLMPVSNITKRSFALSKESGRKAARYFLEKFPDIFKANKSVPHIKAFDPPVTFTESDDVSEKILKDCIIDYDVKNCIDVYNILQKKGISISQQVKQDLLELLCFYNSLPPLPDDYFEERYFQRNEESANKKWDSKGMAEQLFNDMEKDGKAYSSMIAGLSKYGDPERGLLLHNEMKSKNLIGTVEAYNCLISECHLIHEDSSMAWEQANHLLYQMNADGLKPDLYTMNALLRMLSKSARWRKSKQFSMNVVSEMKRLSIEPSLGTYYYLLMIFSDPSSAGILYDIMSYIEGKELDIQHPADVFFFATAMEICWKSLNDKDIAYRLHRVLEFKRNCKLLGNAMLESHYFKCFFRLMCEKEDIDVLMQLYDRYVPNTYTPEPIVTLSIIQAIHFALANKYLPQICSDIILFEQTERVNILEALLEAAAGTKNEEEIQKPLVDMVWNIIQNLNVRAEVKKRQIEWTGVLLGNIIKTFVNGRDVEKAWVIMQKLKKDEHLILGCPDKSPLLEFCEFCLELKDYEKIAYCVQYTVDFYPEFKDEVISLVDGLIKQNKIDETDKDAIINKLGISEPLEDSSSSSSESSGSESSDSDISSSDEEEMDKPKPHT